MNLMDLFIKIGVEDSASGPIKKLSGAVGNGLKTAAKIGTTAIAATAAAVATLAKQAVTAYADYEQLVGGVETLFSNLEGTVSAAPEVLANAERAYRTAGLSANEYMETVTGFSAALIAGLEGDYSRAAEISDMAITDMADNANKMGTSMESIQAAYQGFAKQNYTMLDNLKLGYGGTRSEMERLLSDAEAFSGVHYDISNLADVYEAIHVIQTEMGIAGTTAQEASTTISGSLSMVKAAWRNLLAGLGREDVDMDQLIGELVDSALTAFNNLLPVIGRALKGIGELIVGIAPVIVKELPGLIAQLIPAAVEALTGIINATAEVLPDLLGVLVDQIPVIIPALIAAAANLIGAVAEAIPELLQTIWDKIDDAISGTDFSSHWEEIKEAGSGAADKISESWEHLREAFQPIADVIDRIAEKIREYIESGDAAEDGTTLLITAIDGLGTAIGFVIDYVADFIEGLTQTWEWISEKLHPVLEDIQPIVEAVGQVFKDAWGVITETFDSEWFRSFLDGIDGIFAALYDVMTLHFVDAWEDIKGVFSSWSDFFGGLWGEISDKFTEIGTEISAAIDGAVTAGINGVITSVENIINDAINLINGAIGLINRIPGVNIGTIDSVDFPRLAIGMDRVPYNNYPAYLHKDEAVLTAREADEWRRGGSGNGKVVNLNIYAQQLSQADMDYIVATVNRELA